MHRGSGDSVPVPLVRMLAGNEVETPRRKLRSVKFKLAVRLQREFEPVHTRHRRHPDRGWAEFRHLGAALSRKILERTNHSQSGPPGDPERSICLGSPFRL
jgi:hypothetical protein